MKTSRVVAFSIVALVASACSGKTGAVDAALIPGSGDAAADTGDGYDCHATFTGQLATTVRSIGVVDTSYWYADPTRVPAGEARMMFTCAGLGFRTTMGTTPALFPHAPGHYVIADYKSAPMGSGTEGYNQYAAPAGEIATSVDVSLEDMVDGGTGGGYAVAMPGSFDVALFDAHTFQGTFSYTLQAMTNGAPPLIPSMQIQVTGDFKYECQVGVPTAKCQ